jgi:hypothetical protein
LSVHIPRHSPTLHATSELYLKSTVFTRSDIGSPVLSSSSRMWKSGAKLHPEVVPVSAGSDHDHCGRSPRTTPRYYLTCHAFIHMSRFDHFQVVIAESTDLRIRFPEALNYAPTWSKMPWRLIDLGRSIGRPSALSQMSCARGPSPRLTPKVAV